jgi:hypothetical protein
MLPSDPHKPDAQARDPVTHGAQSPTRHRPWRFQFSLKLLLAAFTVFAIGFPIWYRWPYFETTEVRDPTTGAVAEKRITSWRRQFGGDRIRHGKSQRIFLENEHGTLLSLTQGILGAGRITEHYSAGRRHGPYSMQLAYIPRRQHRTETTGQFADDLREGCWTFTLAGERSVAHYHRGKLHGTLEVDASPPYRRAKIVATFDAGRLIEFNGQRVQDRLVDLLESDAIDERIASELRKDTEIDVIEMPLSDCLLYLSEMHQIPFALDPSLSKPAAPSGDMPITEDYHGIDLCSVLTLLTAPRGLACDYRYGCLWVTTAEDGYNWRDPTGAAEIKPPKGSALQRAWTEISPPVDVVKTPLTKILAYLQQPLAIEIDSSRIEETNVDSPPPLVTVSIPGLRFCDTLGQLLYRTGCRCRLNGETLIVLPAEASPGQNNP